MEYTDEQLRAARMRWFGLTREEIASKLKVPESTVKSWMKSAWWPAAEQEASRLGHDAMVSKARRVLNEVMDAAMKKDAPTPILKEGAAIARWYLERKDPELQGRQTSDEGRALSKLAKMLDSLSPAELAALAQEPVVLGFPNEPSGPDSNTSQNSESAAVAPGLPVVHEPEI